MRMSALCSLSQEIAYLCDAANEYFEHDISPDDVVWTYSGVRPLYDDKSEDASEVTRDYVLNIDEFKKGAPFLSVYGGKITTSRKLAEHVMEKFGDYFEGLKPAWTREAHLPGGDIDDADFEGWFETIDKTYDKIDRKILWRLCRTFGTQIHTLVKNSKDQDIGKIFGGLLSEAEARYLVSHEWANSAEDILWRRTKLGLHLSAEDREAFTAWFDDTFK